MADFKGGPLSEALDRFIEDLEARAKAYETRALALRGLSDQCEEALQAASRLKEWLDREVLVEPAPTEHELARMEIEDALVQLALADKYRLVQTEAVVGILHRAGHLPDHPNQPRVLSGILGASRRFQKIAPGRFRLLDEYEVLAGDMNDAESAQADAAADAAREEADEAARLQQEGEDLAIGEASSD